MDEAFVAKDRIERTVAAGQIVVEIDAEALLAAVSVYPNVSGKAFTEEEITTALQSAKVARGLELDRVHEVIGQAAATNAPVERIIVARGKPARASRDARLDYPGLDQWIAAHPEPGGVADSSPQQYCAAHVVNVSEGETVAVYSPIEDGVAGFTVLGLVLGVKPAVDRTPKPGQNLRWENRDLVATVDGRLIVEERSLRVAEVLEFDKDLTVVQGDVDFVGKIVVGGNIESGVTVRCRKDLVVKGSLIGSNVFCDGDLVVEKGIVGSDDTTIEVRGNLAARNVENANLRVWGAAVIADSFVTSRLLCGDALDMTSGRGHFVSGHAAARGGISVRTVGIRLGTKARLSVGRDMLAKERMDQLTAEIERHKAQLKTIRELDAKVGPMTKAYQKLPTRKQEEIELLLEQIPRLESLLATLQQEVEELRLKLAPASDVKVIVLGTACADTVVEFPFHWTRLATEMVEVAFRFNEQTAKVEGVPAAA